MAASAIAWKISGIARGEDTLRPHAPRLGYGCVTVVPQSPPPTGVDDTDAKNTTTRLHEPADAAAPFGAPGLDLVGLGVRQALADHGAALLDDVHRHALGLFAQRTLDRLHIPAYGLVQLDVVLQLRLGPRRPCRHPVAEVLRQDKGDLVVAAAQRVRITGPLVFRESIHHA